MFLPALKSVTKKTESVVRWLGYNHNDAPAEGSFYDCQNISTELYPLMTVRSGRKAVGIMTGDATCVRDGVLYWAGGGWLCRGINRDGGSEQVEQLAHLTGAASVKRQVIAMGAWVIVFPDGVRYNTQDGTVDSLTVDNQAFNVQLTLCKYDKTAYTDYVVSGTAPSDTDKLWLDTDETPHVLKMYSTSAKDWVSVGTTYVLMTATGLGKGVAVYDTVNVEMQGQSVPEDLTGDMIVYAADDNSIMVAGVLDAAVTMGHVRVKRELPELDYITECNNRLWGCSSKTNELLACKMGDPTNWASYMGLNTDSYRVTVGAPGQFTGAVTFLGYVLFFKENCLLKLFGTKPSNYQISQTNCRGVQRGSEKSLCIVNETLYYKSPVDVVSYDGGLPSSISEALGNVAYKNAAAGCVGGRYYISMQTVSGENRVFCYDVEHGLWSREDDLHMRAIYELNGTGYMVSDENGVYQMMPPGEEDGGVGLGMNWWAETGMLGIGELNAKYLNRFQLRVWLPDGSTLTVKVRYDDGAWIPMQTVQGSKNASVLLPVVLQRCDHAALRLEGSGVCKLFNLNKVMQMGGAVR